MIVVLSGEGPTDLGQCGNGQNTCEDDGFQIGPMAVLLDKMLESRLGYSQQEIPGGYVYVSEGGLAQQAQSRKRGRCVSLVGKKRDQELGFFVVTAWVLANIAKEIEAGRNDQSIAVLFRDCDGTRSAKTGLWEAKWQSMINGFDRADFSRGVPMIPKPKSEAWLLCLARLTVEDCACFEEISGNDASPKSAKKQLEDELGEHMNREELCDWLNENWIGEDRFSSMPSFNAFRHRLGEALGELTH